MSNNEPSDTTSERYITITYSIDLEERLWLDGSGAATPTPYQAGDVTSARPGDAQARDEYGDITIVRASKAEQEEWQHRYEALQAETAAAVERLKEARTAWEAAQTQAQQDMQRAWADYEPVQHTITERREEAEELEDAIEQAETDRKAREEEARQADEDAVLGPRDWVVYRKESHQVNRRSDWVPVVHRLGCRALDGKSKWTMKRVRAEEARKVLYEGTPAYAGASLVLGRQCGRCKPGFRRL